MKNIRGIIAIIALLFIMTGSYLILNELFNKPIMMGSVFLLFGLLLFVDTLIK